MTLVPESTFTSYSYIIGLFPLDAMSGWHHCIRRVIPPRRALATNIWRYGFLECELIRLARILSLCVVAASCPIILPRLHLKLLNRL